MRVTIPLLILLLCNIAGAGEPVAPRTIIRPFEAKDLSTFTTWLKSTGRRDPKRVFSLPDGVFASLG